MQTTANINVSFQGTAVSEQYLYESNVWLQTECESLRGSVDCHHVSFCNADVLSIQQYSECLFRSGQNPNAIAASIRNQGVKIYAVSMANNEAMRPNLTAITGNSSMVFREESIRTFLSSILWSHIRSGRQLL